MLDQSAGGGNGQAVTTNALASQTMVIAVHEQIMYCLFDAQPCSSSGLEASLLLVQAHQVQDLLVVHFREPLLVHLNAGRRHLESGSTFHDNI